MRARTLSLVAVLLLLTTGSSGDVSPSAPAPDAPLPAHARDVVDYTLRATLDPTAHTLHGEGTLTWRNSSAIPVRELWVHLYLNAFKSPESTFLRTPDGYRGTDRRGAPGSIDVRRFVFHDGPSPGVDRSAPRADSPSTDLWPNAELHRPGDLDETDARVPLPRDVAPGEAIQIEVAFDDHIPELVARAGYVGGFHLIAQWFPKIARLEPDGRWAHFPYYREAEFYADYGRYDVTLDVPQSVLLGATGPAVESRIEGGRRIERHVQGDVHDFAWTAWDQWQVAKEMIDGISVSVLHPPGFHAEAQRHLRALRFALPWLEARLGRYPYDVLTVVQPPGWLAAEAGSMEYPTFLTTSGTWYPIPGTADDEATTIHELAHQWFYGTVGTNEVDWPFLDEGLATYEEHACLRAWRGKGSELDLLGMKLDTGELRAAGSAAAAHDAPIAQPAYAFDPPDDVSDLVYGRTAALLETLARVYGDGPLELALGRYARRFRFEHPGPEELLAVFRDAMGEKVERTLRTALFEEGWVDYVLAEISDDGSIVVQRHGTLSFPVEIELVRVDGVRRRVHWDGESTVLRIPYHDDVPLRAAVVDPDHAVLLDPDPSNDFATAPGQRSAGAPRTLERVLYWAELAMQAVP